MLLFLSLFFIITLIVIIINITINIIIIIVTARDTSSGPLPYQVLCSIEISVS